MKGVMIGAGFFGGIQAEAWQRIEEARMAAVADPVPGKAQAFAARWGIPRAYTDATEMLARERPDFVDIATRPDTHLPLTRLAAEHGVHVICQKPMAPELDACRGMVESCRDAGVRLLIHENWRWQPWYREIKRLLEEGAVGPLFQLSFRLRTGDGRGDEPYPVQPYFRDMPRLLVYETLVHYLDTFRFLAGEVESIFCQIDRLNPVIAGEDYALVQMRFVSGVHGLIDANRINGPSPATKTIGTMHVEGRHGVLRLDDHGQLFLTRPGQAEQQHLYAWPDEGYRGDSVRATQRHCVRALRDGAPCESEGENYLRTVALVDACYRSAETQDRVVLED